MFRSFSTGKGEAGGQTMKTICLFKQKNTKQEVTQNTAVQETEIK